MCEGRRRTGRGGDAMKLSGEISVLCTNAGFGFTQG